MPTKLTRKQQGFVNDYLETGNATLAVKQNYDVVDDNSARALGSENLAKLNIRTVINSALESQSITPEWIISQHKGLALGSKNDMAKTRNLEDLGQIADIYPKRGQVDINAIGITSISWQE